MPPAFVVSTAGAGWLLPSGGSAPPSLFSPRPGPTLTSEACLMGPGGGPCLRQSGSRWPRPSGNLCMCLGGGGGEGGLRTAEWAGSALPEGPAVRCLRRQDGRNPSASSVWAPGAAHLQVTLRLRWASTCHEPAAASAAPHAPQWTALCHVPARLRWNFPPAQDTAAPNRLCGRLTGKTCRVFCAGTRDGDSARLGRRHRGGRRSSFRSVLLVLVWMTRPSAQRPVQSLQELEKTAQISLRFSP